jgi:hypothetical protein
MYINAVLSVYFEKDIGLHTVQARRENQDFQAGGAEGAVWMEGVDKQD